jgi:hypothetical protein
MKCKHCGQEIRKEAWITWIIVPKLGIEIKDELVVAPVFNELKVPKGFRLLNAHEALTIAHDKELCERLELKKYWIWLQPYCKEWAVSLDYYDGDFLVDAGDFPDDYYDGRSRAIFCRDLKEIEK